ncbi:hypothetical protein N7449_003225 [Penicillium cf. viridicatum]|uniref:Uncharacterized protein n=1 Tax=Penicillium cf. viridicatum TaxID=2972119 RepID=A0A9W9MWM0_9EURO|nr:hypothetical protein N7449_003225 [Penicillium cf. viridicatum]
MKFTGLTVSLALAGLSYSAALPVLGNAEGTVSGIEGTVGRVTGSAANIVAPITSTAGGLTSAIKRDDTAALGETVETIPSIANGAVAIAGSAAGTGESLVSGAAGTAENAVSGSAAKRQLNDLIGSTLGSAIPAIIQEAKAGGVAGAVKRDGTAALGETVEAIPNLANSASTIASSAVGTGESLVSGAAGTAENAVPGSAAKRQLNDLIGSTLGSAIPAIIQEAKAGGVAGAVKRDGTAALGETVEAIPNLANSASTIAGSAVGTAENVVGHP